MNSSPNVPQMGFPRKFQHGMVLGVESVPLLYLGGAVGGSLFYLMDNIFMAPSSEIQTSDSSVPALGASGAVNAIMLCNIFLFPKTTIHFDYFIRVGPVPTILLGAIIIGLDMLQISKGDSQASGSVSLGGARSHCCCSIGCDEKGAPTILEFRTSHLQRRI